ncbi:MAG TPA: type II secretion system inner membrane protein GspF [Pseudomonadales bacterium]
MAAFSYQAIDSNGKKTKGVLEGDSARQVRQLLKEKGLKPLEVELSTSNSSQQKTGAGLRMRRARMKTTEMALFTRQLATLVQSGLPLDEALKAVANQSGKQSIKTLVLEIRAKVIEGHTLAYALGEFPKVFSNMYIAMVQAGEHAGFLGIVLERLADHVEGSQYTQQKIKMAMIYPIILVMIAFSVISALMVMVVPKLVKIFDNSDTELPALTRALINVSDFMVDYGLYSLVLLVLLVLAVRRLLQAPQQRYRLHRLLLNMPLLANTFRTVDSARFSSTLSILIASGVPLLEAIRIAAAVLNNRVMQDVCQEVAGAVQEGSSFSKALEQAGEFPPMLVHMVASGEASGELETMLERVAKNQERELEMNLGALMSIMEPALIVFMGGMVLLIVLAVLMPIFQMNTLI